MRRWRVFSVPLFFVFWTVVIVFRLFFVQIIKHHKYVEEAANQQERTFQVEPRRGIIYDRDLHGLAMTVYAESAYAVPWQVGADKAHDAKLLAAIVHTNPEDRYTSAHDILARMQASRDFAWVARKMDPSVYRSVKALHLKGIYFQREFKRYYPDQKLASHVLGFVGSSGNGLGGLEYQFNKELEGTPGRMYTAVDARRHVLGSKERDPKPGENLVLTIDANIQYMADKALDANMARTKAKRGIVIVQDPHTGQILALAVRPTFNPNHYRYDNPDLLVDHAVSDVFEPGSMFKIVTYSAALQQHAISMHTMLHTLGGSINIHGRIVHDDSDVIRFEHQHGNVLTVQQALAQSSNVAAIQVGERLGKDELYHYIREFGFGQRTGIRLPGETAGLLRPPNLWGPTAIGSVPMGYAVGITPIQLVSMASTVANGGIYLPPRIVMNLTTKSPGDGLRPDPYHPETSVPNPLPPGAHRVISELTAARMRKLLEGVVDTGTGIPAQLNGYSAAGKTGTAEKIDPRTHTYSKRLYVASFVGFAPVNDPAVTIAVITDAPEYKYRFGTSASAPVFRELAQEILEYLGVPHDEPVKTPKEIAQEIRNAPKESDPQEQIEDMDSLFAAVNHLPANDPLRSNSLPGVAPVVDQRVAEDKSLHESGAPPTAAPQDTIKASTPAPAPSSVSVPAPTISSNAVTVSAQPTVTVPSFAGESVRDVIEKAEAAGLGIQVLGSGLAAEQVPAAGTRVPRGTQIVVRFHP
jgi:cell division protein FtsI (penicillin-binding protein 3)